MVCWNINEKFEWDFGKFFWENVRKLRVNINNNLGRLEVKFMKILYNFFRDSEIKFLTGYRNVYQDSVFPFFSRGVWYLVFIVPQYPVLFTEIVNPAWLNMV